MMQCTTRRVCAWKYVVLLSAHFTFLQSEMDIPPTYQLRTASPTAHLELNGTENVPTTTEPPSETEPNIEWTSIRRYLTNSSYIGQSIPCTEDEKDCFHFNLLSKSYECQEPDGYNGSDINKYLDRNGHLQNIPSTLIKVEQPEEERRCRIPDLRFPYRRSDVFQNPFRDIQGYEVDDDSFRPLESIPRFSCSSEQAQCFSKGEVWVAEGQGCFPLLQQGPCAEEHVVALDEQAARDGRAEATCVHVRGGCPQGHVRMAFDSQCHKDQITFIFGAILRNQFGKFVFIRVHYSILFRPFREESVETEAHDLCGINASLIKHYITFGPGYVALKLNCGPSVTGDCLFEVKQTTNDRDKPQK